MLNERRATILTLVVNEYVQTAEPVSSKALVDRHGLSVSSATIRNELARLEEDGYVTHPYTSAGRVPSDLGYRHYVEALMAEDPVREEERRTVEHQFHQARGGVDVWLGLAATVLAGWVGNVAVLTRPRGRVTRLRHVQIVELGSDAALLVAVLEDGRVGQRTLPLSEPATQDRLTERSAWLNARLAGLDAAAVRRLANETADQDLGLAHEHAAADALATVLEEFELLEETYLEGVRNTLRQPEFASPDRMLDAVQHLEAYRVRQLLQLAGDLPAGATRVLIGGEHGVESMADFSVIVASYGDEEGSTGTIAVLGPTRMHYERTIPRVRYLAALMTSLLQVRS